MNMSQTNQTVQFEQDLYGNKFEVGCKVLCIESGRKGKVLDIIYGEIHVKFQGNAEVEIHYNNSLIVLESAEEQEIDFIKDVALFCEFKGAKHIPRIKKLAHIMTLLESFDMDAKNYDEILLQYLEKKYGEDKANK